MRRYLRAFLVAGLTVALLGLFLRHANLTQVWAEMRNGDPTLLVLSIVAMLPAFVLRTWRWQYLLQPIGPARFAPCFRTTMIGFAMSSLLPARAGEFVRPYLLARQERLSATAVFATIVIERVLDLTMVVLLFAAFALLFDPGMAQVDARVYGAVQLGALAAAAGAVVGLAVMFALAGHPERLGRATLRIERVLPARLVRILAHLLETFAQGLAVMRQPRRLLIALALSLPLWLALALEMWLATLAFHITLPFTGSFLLLAFAVVGVAVPTPGGVGGYHEAFRIAATTFYAAPNDRAVGAAIVLHMISFGPVTLLGLYFMLRDGLNLRAVRAAAAAEKGTDSFLVVDAQDGRLRSIQ